MDPLDSAAPTGDSRPFRRGEESGESADGGRWARVSEAEALGLEAWRMEFSDEGVARLAIDARFDALRKIHAGDAQDRAAAIHSLSVAPFLRCGGHREWAELAQAVGATREATPQTMREAEKMNARATLGEWMPPEETERPPLEGVVSRGESGSWIFTPQTHWLLDAVAFGDMLSLRALLEAGADPRVSRQLPETEDRADRNARLAADGLPPLPPSKMCGRSYCLSLLEMDMEEWQETGIGFAEGEDPESRPIEERRAKMRAHKAAAFEIVCLLLSFGLPPQEQIAPAATACWRSWAAWASRDRRKPEGLPGDLVERVNAAIESFEVRQAAQSIPGEEAGSAAERSARVPLARRI